MRFVYCGYDYAIDSLFALLDAGHELAGILSFPCDEAFSYNNQVRQLARDLNIPFTQDKPTAQTITDFIDQSGMEAILALGYAYKLPPIQDLAGLYGVNVHPALLPKARGLMPLPHIIMHDPEAAGVTIHKLTQHIDCGDILMQHAITLQPDHDAQSLAAQIAMTLPAMMVELMSDLPRYWAQATPQDEGAAYKVQTPDDAMRTLDWGQSVRQSLDKMRAFGSAGVLFSLSDERWVAYKLSGWQQPDHGCPIGAITFLSPRDIVIAVQDGFICISEAQKLEPTP